MPATANIFSAGLSAPVDPAGGGAGTLPVAMAISTDNGKAFQFQASGEISQYYNVFIFGPDGWTGSSMNINAYGGISGYLGATTLLLMGVFLGDELPQAPALNTLDFRAGGLGQDFLSLSPGIGQLFFIGDGQTSAGQVQTFYAPPGATRLFLGFPDAVNSVGDPGSYGDNFGSLEVAVTQAPEPATEVLILLGGVLLGWLPRHGRALFQSKPQPGS